MNDDTPACPCTDCIGATCTCGCQATGREACEDCQCGCRQGKPCQCGKP